MRLIGDGDGTTLSWTGADGGAVLRLAGPSKATLCDFTIRAAGKAAGIVAANCDQRDARILADEVSLQGGQIGLRSRLSRTNVELYDFLHAGNKLGVQVDAGDVPATLPETERGHLAIFGGASSNNTQGYALSGGASLLLQDLCYSGGGSLVKLTGAGTFTCNGGNLSTSSDDAAGVTLDHFQGNAVFLGVPFSTPVQVLGDAKQTNALLLGVLSPDARLLPATAPAQFALLDSPVPRKILHSPPPTCPTRATTTYPGCATCWTRSTPSTRVPPAPSLPG